MERRLRWDAGGRRVNAVLKRTGHDIPIAHVTRDEDLPAAEGGVA